jgi:hypothetical protein
MALALGDLKEAGQRHAMRSFVKTIQPLKYQALAWAKQE